MAREPKEVTFEWHIETVSGDEAEVLRQAQAEATLELARWLAKDAKGRAAEGAASTADG